MVDLHAHVVWGVDDGPQTLEDSLALLRAAFQSGTTDIVATPHANPRFPYQLDLVLARIAELNRLLQGSPRIHRGCEFHLTFDNVDSLLASPTTYTINGLRYLLIECPDSHIGRHTESILNRILESRLVPVIAHPERNPVLRKDLKKLEDWVSFGCLLQLTSQSLTGGFGSSARTASFQLLERGLAHIVSSDAHDTVHRPPQLTESRHLVTRRFGEEASEILFVETPRAVIEGSPVGGGRQITWEPSIPWYKFWKSR